MSKLSGGRRLLTEDFSAEDQELIRKLAFVLNPFLEEVTNSLQKNLSVAENLTMEFKDLDVEVDGSGFPTNTAKFQTSFSKVTGLLVVNHTVLTTGASLYPANGIYCTFKQSNNIIEVNHITGLNTSTKYRLRLLVLSS